MSYDAEFNLNVVDTVHLLAEVKRRGFTVLRTAEVRDLELSFAEPMEKWLLSTDRQTHVKGMLARQMAEAMLADGAIRIGQRVVASPSPFPGREELAFLTAKVRVVIPAAVETSEPVEARA